MSNARRTFVGEVQSTYGSGDEDYSSLALWEVASRSSGNPEALIVSSGTYDDYVYMNASANPRRICPAEGADHDGTEFNGVKFSTATGSTTIYVAEASHIQGLIVSNTKAGVAATGIVLATDDAVAVDCIVCNVLNGTGGYGIYSQANSFIINCLTYNILTSGFEHITTAKTLRINNCRSIYNAYGIRRSDGTVVATNCNCHDNSTADFDGTITQVTCSTSTPTYIDEGGDDFRLDAAFGTATDMSSDANYPFSTDYLEVERGATWDIGPHQYIDPTIYWSTNIRGVSSTSDITASLTRNLSANIRGVSSTSDASANIERNFSADIRGVSTTSDVLVAVARSLPSDIRGVSSTPNIQGKISRYLSANIQGASSTPNISSLCSRIISVNIQGESDTPDIAAIITRYISASIQGQSETTNIAALVTRTITASILGQSSTADIIAILTRYLTTDIQGASSTPDIAALVTRYLSANIRGESATTDITAKLHRYLSASIQGESITPGIVAAITRYLSTNIQGQSSTTDIEAMVCRYFTANIQGGSFTPDIVALIARLFSAGILGQSVTPDIDSILARLVAIDTSIESATPILTIV